MHKLFLSLFAIVFASTVAVAAEGDSAAPPVAEQAIPSAYVWFSGGSVAIGIGYTWGHGTLYYSKDQKQYAFRLSGVSIADVGAAGITAEGEVYNLSRPADLSGNYSAVTAGATVIEGGSVAYGRRHQAAFADRRAAIQPVRRRYGHHAPAIVNYEGAAHICDPQRRVVSARRIRPSG
jgi:hypothetical protein